VMLTAHPVLVPRLRKSWAIPPLTLWVLLSLLRGSLYRYLYYLFGITNAHIITVLCILIFYNFSKRNIKAPWRLCRSSKMCRSVCNII
jgi:O-antigen ligase